MARWNLGESRWIVFIVRHHSAKHIRLLWVVGILWEQKIKCNIAGEGVLLVCCRCRCWRHCYSNFISIRLLDPALSNDDSNAHYVNVFVWHFCSSSETIDNLYALHYIARNVISLLFKKNAIVCRFAGCLLCVSKTRCVSSPFPFDTLIRSVLHESTGRCNRNEWTHFRCHRIRMLLKFRLALHP